MFNHEQYDILKRCSERKNIAEWNKYRVEHPDTKINLQNADLRRAKLEGAKLNEACLDGARFEEADLFAADLRRADLRRADLEKANLWGATLSEANLEDASLVSANLQNADLRRVNLERVNLWGADLEDAITTEVPAENLSSTKETVETIINIIDNITYEELMSLMKCLEALSVSIGGSLPRLNEIQIGQYIEKHAAWAGTAMENLISIEVPKNVAENFHRILNATMIVGQSLTEVPNTELAAGKKDLEVCEGLQRILVNAGFSADERQAISATLQLPKMDENRMMEDLRMVAKLVKCRRISFRVPDGNPGRYYREVWPKNVPGRQVKAHCYT